jgi:hypothetical membrane protein
MIERLSSGKGLLLGRIAGGCGIMSQLVGLSVLSVAITGSPWFSWTGNYISILGVQGSNTVLFNSGLILCGLLGLIFALGLGKTLLPGRFGQWGAVTLALGSLALSGIGVFPLTHELAHYAAATGFFASIHVAIFLVGVMAITRSQKTWGVISFIVILFAVAARLAPWPWSGGAIEQVLSCLPSSVWTGVLAVRLLRKTARRQEKATAS